MTGLTDTRHPAPQRDRVAFVALAFALAAAPAAWAAHQIVNYVLAVHPCFPNDEARTSPLPGWGADRAGVLVIDLAGLLVALAGAYVGWRSFRAVRTEHPGDDEELLRRGEGRTRFLAMAGLLISLGFAGAIVFDTISSLMAPLCQT